ncbi:TetR/AcrR family transcriptional regulator [Streptomyces sp. 891-h]|uniref:TetR/AcrR family transcriptional regulator n=1 Tax=unclassified Streptomyces TaxID=2593676 RepID=UPI001FAAFA64|nr:TetR/AcrR family transcriptional regulator [Streptomyces sp. 891-h]UNZ16173.1 TetR/AcrR family transcriptional regulator [Streptomyces sp. 891-h]
MRSDAKRNREQILDAAREIFVNEGPDAPLETVARRAGVGIATLYRRFPSREELIRAVAAETVEALYSAVRRAREQESDPFEALRRFMHAAVEMKIGAVLPSLFGLPVMERTFREVRDPAHPLEELLGECKAAGALRPDAVAGDVIFMIVRLTRPLPGGRFAEDVPLAHRQLEIYLGGLRASPGPARRKRLPGPVIDAAWFRRLRSRMFAGRPPRDS